MAILAASIEANGWVLRLRVSGSPGSFASYTLDPDGIPRVNLAANHLGYVPSAGAAVPGSLNRALVATKPLRKPVNPAAPTTFLVDETDQGDGSLIVRLALSDWVHATDTGLTLNVAAGWRSGEAAAAGIAVINGSTHAAPLPVMRWADVPYQLVDGAFTLELVVFSHFPQGVQPVAGVRFTATDGTTTKSVWATALTTSTRYGDAARVYGATIDPASATAFTAGLLRCDAEVYPWLGAMRSTDTAGTRSVSGLATAGYGSAAQSPMIVGYDPTGSRYGSLTLYVDPAGTATPSAGMVKTSLAAAKALAPAARPLSISVALQALYLFNRGLAAANGGIAATRAADAARIVLAPTVHAGVTGTSVTSGLTSSELPVVVEGDPDDPDPRSNCIIQIGTSGSTRISKMVLRNLAFEVGGTTLAASTLIYWWLDNVEVRGRAGFETNGVAPASAAAPAGRANMFATRSRWWRSGSGFSGSTLRFGLLRNCEFSRGAEACAIIGGRFIPASEDPTVTGVTSGVSPWGSASDQGALEDAIMTGLDMRGIRGRVFSPSSVAAANAGTPNNSIRRLVFANNLCERFGTDPQPFWSMGEDASSTMNYIIIEGNSFIGERCNILYSDPQPTTLADTDTQQNQAYGNRVANNSFDWAATKHDAFADPQTLSVRNAAGDPRGHGYRPQLTETWSVTYGVGFEGNYDWGRHPSAGNFRFEYFGRRAVQQTGGVPAWPADRSTYGSPATGGGTYKPPAASPLIGRGLATSADRDRTGAVRTVPFASGAVDTASAAAVPVAPASAAHTALSGSPVLAWAGGLGPAGARLTMRAGSPLVGFAAALAPADARHASASGEPALTTGEPTLRPAPGNLALADIGVAVLPDLIFATARLVRIEGEVRVQLINP